MGNEESGKAETRQLEALSAGVACEAVLRPTTGPERRDSHGLPPEGSLLSTCPTMFTLPVRHRRLYLNTW